jgi:hypothetical protein
VRYTHARARAHARTHARTITIWGARVTLSTQLGSSDRRLRSACATRCRCSAPAKRARLQRRLGAAVQAAGAGGASARARARTRIGSPTRGLRAGGRLLSGWPQRMHATARSRAITTSAQIHSRVGGWHGHTNTQASTHTGARSQARPPETRARTPAHARALGHRRGLRRRRRHLLRRRRYTCSIGLRCQLGVCQHQCRILCQHCSLASSPFDQRHQPAWYPRATVCDAEPSQGALWLGARCRPGRWAESGERRRRGRSRDAGRLGKRSEETPRPVVCGHASQDGVRCPRRLRFRRFLLLKTVSAARARAHARTCVRSRTTHILVPLCSSMRVLML